MNKQKNCNNIWRIEYQNNDDEKGYSYFVDNQHFGYDLIEVFHLAARTLHIPTSYILGIRKISKLPSSVGDCYFTI